MFLILKILGIHQFLLPCLIILLACILYVSAISNSISTEVLKIDIIKLLITTKVNTRIKADREMYNRIKTRMMIRSFILTSLLYKADVTIVTSSNIVAGRILSQSIGKNSNISRKLKIIRPEKVLDKTK